MKAYKDTWRGVWFFALSDEDLKTSFRGLKFEEGIDIIDTPKVSLGVSMIATVEVEGQRMEIKADKLTDAYAAIRASESDSRHWARVAEVELERKENKKEPLVIIDQYGNIQGDEE